MSAAPHRLSRYDYVGIHRHFLTISTHRGRRHFKRPDIVASTLAQIQRAARDQAFSISAYCFMPNHLHALVAGESEDSDFLDFVRLAKQLSSYEFRRTTGRRLWKPSYWDGTVRGSRDATDVIRYIVLNPVKAGLVTTPAEYPFWGSETHTREELLKLLEASDPITPTARPTPTEI